MRRMIGFLMMVGLVSGVGCGDDDSSPTSSSVSQDKYSETIVGTWNDGGEPILTFNDDGTVVYDGSEGNYTWSIDGSTLTIFGEDGEVFERHEITSLSNTEYVFADPEYPDIKTTLTR